MTDSPTNWSDERVLEEVKALRVGYGMKRTLRYNTTRDFSVHNESVAEHLFALHYLAVYFLQFEDFSEGLNKSQIHDIITFHDFGEIIHGDVPTHIKTSEHERQEREDAQVIFAALPASIREAVRVNWEDYADQKSAEAKFVYALDKIEPLFELFDPVNERSMKRLKHSYKNHFQKKLSATEKFPTMRRFVDVISKDMLSRKIFWDNSTD